MNPDHSHPGYSLLNDGGRDRSSCGSGKFQALDPVVVALKNLTNPGRNEAPATASLVDRVAKYWENLQTAARAKRVTLPRPAVNYAGAGTVGLVWNNVEFHFEPDGSDAYVRDADGGTVTDGALPPAPEAVELIAAA